LRPIGDTSTDRSLIDNRQRITIGALGGTLVPAAPDPFQASGPDDLRWVPETSTLVTIDGDLRTGDTIDIVSAAPQVDAARLNAATSSEPPDPIHTSVPADLPEVVGATARQVTAGATSTYEAALTLQMWFQEQFEYSLEVRPGHGNSAIEAFLRDRIGYCEQFAGHVRRHAAHARHSVSGRSRVHVGRAGRRRGVLRARTQCSRLAGGVVRRHRLDRVRADTGARRAERAELHPARPATGHLGGGRRHRGQRHSGADHRCPPGRSTTSSVR
jgi:hypothetical protein